MMRTLLLGRSSAILVGAISAVAALSGEPVSQESARGSLVTQAQYERWQVDLSNWGRWGKDDEMGTLNLITPPSAKQPRHW
jgi:hypothetical protein